MPHQAMPAPAEGFETTDLKLRTPDKIADLKRRVPEQVITIDRKRRHKLLESRNWG
jgi:hypothetical protein